MLELLVVAGTLAAALGCGLIAGVFFAFSSFVMQALAHIPCAEGIRAMQSINRVVLRSWFLVVFLGTAAVCALLLVYAVLRWQAPDSAWLVGGALLYLAGSLLVTIACNVPRNEALDALDAARPESDAPWRDYVTGWSLWNHVRTVASLAAAAALTLALLQRSG
ncbi:MAG: anthrone oxygenase family protein [Gammaproteobacteria bacterium]|nr:anthrone oxygenase family protein [Gammaproteobacteria bacterium]